MIMQDTVRKILEADNQYYKSFADFINTDYGILYYNTDDPEWTDFNHACVLNYNKASDFGAIIKDIKNFYISKDLRPFIYSDFTRGQRELMQADLIENGFIIEDNYGGQTFVIHTSECKINAPYTLEFKKISNGGDLSCIYKIMKDKEDAEDIETRFKNPGFSLFVGYLSDDTPVVTADLECFDGIVLLDDVETAEEYQGKGYARQMIRFLVDYHYKNHQQSLLYLYYDNPVAGRIYSEAGFTEAHIELWAAYCG